MSYINTIRLFSSALLVLATTALADKSNFVTVRLPHSFTLDLPNNWWLLGKDYEKNLDTALEAIVDLTGLDLGEDEEINLITANSMPKTTYASIRVDLFSESEDELLKFEQMGVQELAELEKEMINMLPIMASAQGNEILEFYGVTKGTLTGHPTLSTRYKRSGPQGAVVVEILQIILAGKSFHINLAYREQERAMWKPIIDRVRASIVVGE